MMYWALIGFVSIFAIVFGGAGLHMERTIAQNSNGEPVRVRVVDLQSKRGENGIVYSPVYEIISGQHEGHRWISTLASSSPKENIGDEENGFYNSKTGAIQSITGGKMQSIFAMIFTSAGFGVLCGLAFFVARTWRLI